MSVCVCVRACVCVIEEVCNNRIKGGDGGEEVVVYKWLWKKKTFNNSHFIPTNEAQ